MTVDNDRDGKAPVQVSEGSHTSQRRGRGLAIAALVCGIASFVWGVFTAPLAVVAVLLGTIVLVKGIRNPRRYRGKVVATLAIITGVVALALIPLWLLPRLADVREEAQRTATRSRLFAISTGLETYRAHPAFGHYPPSRLRPDPITDYEGGTSENRLSGAHWLARALVGHDLRGVDRRVFGPEPVSRSELDVENRADTFFPPDPAIFIRDTSVLSRLNCRVQAAEFYSGVCGGEPPIDRLPTRVAILLPAIYGSHQGRLVRDSTAHALP